MGRPHKYTQSKVHIELDEDMLNLAYLYKCTRFVCFEVEVAQL